MEFADVVRRRHMVRSFDDRPVDPSSLERILDAARRGPSAGFSQGFEFLVLAGPDETARYWDAVLPAEARDGFAWPGLLRTPVIVVPCTHKQAYLDRYAEVDKGWTDKDESRWPVPYWLVDTSFAAMVMLLAAVDEGLGAVFFGVGDTEALRREFGVLPDYAPIGAIAMGHPAADDRPSQSVRRGRRPRDEVVHRGRW